MKKRGVLCALVVAGLAPAAMAQWSDNFDAYPLGSIDGMGGWQGWDGTPAFAGIVSDTVARSGRNSQKIDQASDSVHLYPGVETGAWTFTTYQYIPSSFTGISYFIMLNTYQDGGPNDWSIQLNFDSTTGVIIDEFRPGSPVPFVRDAWAELRVDIDFTANTVSQFYNGSLIASGTWTTGTPSALDLSAVDLFGNTGTNVYYDDMSFVPAPSALALAGLAGLVGFRRRRA